MKPNSLLLLLALFVCCLLSTTVYAQLQNKGFWTRNLLNYRSEVRKEDYSGYLYRNKSLLLQPEIGYAIGKRFLIGLVGQYRTDKASTQDILQGYVERRDVLYGAGPLLRYYLPITDRLVFMPEVFFVYYQHKSTTLHYDAVLLDMSMQRYNSIGAGAFPSLVGFLTRDLAISLTVASLQYYGNANNKSFIVEANPQHWILGLEYYFEKPKKKTP
ncbi:MAG: hypothetical protein JNM36_05775 [Chitinophagales bacterium]|nr:hypothetical protein [Chitinophagales bacterium]